jgi:hypothetical protein
MLLIIVYSPFSSTVNSDTKPSDVMVAMVDPAIFKWRCTLHPCVLLLLFSRGRDMGRRRMLRTYLPSRPTCTTCIPVRASPGATQRNRFPFPSLADAWNNTGGANRTPCGARARISPIVFSDARTSGAFIVAAVCAPFLESFAYLSTAANVYSSKATKSHLSADDGEHALGLMVQ